MTILSEVSSLPNIIILLIEWFEQQAANLPWRQTDNPYFIWLSEIMLQQTQVTTVIPYYERFTKRFPTIKDLADAPQDDLMKMWEGLGYYSRARNLQAAAKQVMEEYGGELPHTAAELRNLKGIGRYTAGAIASIAFEEPAPVVDGNVIRVFSRIFNIDDDVRQQATKNKIWDLAESLMPDVPAGRAGDYNQALMELGREICKPRNPRCDLCPINQHCKAFKFGVQEERPVKSKKAPTPHYDVTCGVIRNEQGELLITKRPADKLLGGLWEFPGGKVENGETFEESLARELHEELGIQVNVGDFFMQVKHGYTHFKITLYAYECRLRPESALPKCHDCDEFQWVPVDNLTEFAFGKADRKIVEELQQRPYKLL
jgi:A/G-specific adenine glycosylase